MKNCISILLLILLPLSMGSALGQEPSDPCAGKKSATDLDFFMKKVLLPSFALSGIEKAITYPFEVISVRQSASGKKEKIDLATMKKGFCIAYVARGLKTATALSVNKYSLEYFDSHQDYPLFSSKIFNKVMAGAIAGVSEIVWNPLSVIKQDLQTGKYPTFFTSIKQRPVNSYFNGASAGMWRNAVSCAVIFPMIQAGPFGKNDPIVYNVLYGGFSGMVAAFLSWPFQFLKVRAASFSEGKTPGNFAIIKQTFAENNHCYKTTCARIYKGIVPAAARIAVQGAVISPLFHYFLNDKN